MLVLVNLITLIDVLNVPNLGIISERTDGRVTGPVQEVNQYGAILIFIIPLTAGLAMSSLGTMRFIYMFGTALAAMLLALTVSRGSFVGLFVGGLAAIWLAREHVHKRAIQRGAVIVIIGLIIAGIAVFMYNPEGVLKKLDFEGADINSISSGRLDVWGRVLTMMSYEPITFLTGYGWDSYKTLIGIYGDPHNTYLLYFFHLGLIGLLTYSFIAIWTVRFTVKSLKYIRPDRKPMVIGFLAGFMSVHVAIFFVLLYQPWLFMWAITGSMLRVIVDERHEALHNARQTQG